MNMKEQAERALEQAWATEWDNTRHHHWVAAVVYALLAIAFAIQEANNART
jgi:hypothetical protein